MIPENLKSKWTALLHDALVIPVAWMLAFWLRVNLQEIPAHHFQAAYSHLIYIIPVQLTVFYYFGLYRGIWRFASLPDLIRILKGVAVGITVSMLVIFIMNRGVGIPRSVPFFYAILLTMLLSGPRMLYRYLKDHHLHIPRGKKVLIVGSGNAGEMLARDILRNQNDAYYPVAFIDDNPGRQGREIHGLPIAGKTVDIPKLAKQYEIDLIMIAVPSAKPKDMRRIVEICETSGVPFRTLPHLQDLISGQVSVNELRQISIKDLLGREPVTLDWESINNTLSGKIALVTGSGGSIGSELCRQLAELKVKKLIILDSSEFNLYQIEMELSKKYPELELIHLLGDVTDNVFINALFNKYKPEIVFHAAAYKHVPMLENQIRQAIRNNIVGTKNTADAARQFGTDIFVLVSTDKAVNPANIMGATKRAAEIYCQNLNSHSDTNYVTVRFGNVLGSAGSVIPLFQKQIENGGPVTVTDPRMERYFMTIPEACQLIMQQKVLGSGGEIFVLDMGEPVKISYLADQMIRLSGKTPNEDINIEYIGLRPGEKLFEELFHEKEQLEGTGHKKVFLARHRKVDWDELQNTMSAIQLAVDELDEEKLAKLLKKLVPEHQAHVEDTNSTKSTADNVVHLNSVSEPPLSRR